MYYQADTGSTVTFVLSIFDAETQENNPVTSVTNAYVIIKRMSDGKYYNWTNNTWDTVSNWSSLTSDHKKTLTNNDDGSYTTSWNQQSADSGNEADYIVIYYVDDTTYFYLGHELWKFRTPPAPEEENETEGESRSYPKPI